MPKRFPPLPTRCWSGKTDWGKQYAPSIPPRYEDARHDRALTPPPPHRHPPYAHDNPFDDPAPGDEPEYTPADNSSVVAAGGVVADGFRGVHGHGVHGLGGGGDGEGESDRQGPGPGPGHGDGSGDGRGDGQAHGQGGVTGDGEVLRPQQVLLVNGRRGLVV